MCGDDRDVSGSDDSDGGSTTTSTSSTEGSRAPRRPPRRKASHPRGGAGVYAILYANGWTGGRSSFCILYHCIVVHRIMLRPTVCAHVYVGMSRARRRAARTRGAAPWGRNHLDRRIAQHFDDAPDPMDATFRRRGPPACTLGWDGAVRVLPLLVPDGQGPVGRRPVDGDPRDLKRWLRDETLAWMQQLSVRRVRGWRYTTATLATADQTSRGHPSAGRLWATWSTR